MLWGVSALKCFVFQKIVFSRFFIDQTCCSTNRNCDKKLSLNLPGSIVSWLMLDQSIESNTNRKSLREFFKTSFFTCSSLFQTFQKASLSLSSNDPDSSQIFVVFLPNFSQGFCLLVQVRHFYPLFFVLFLYFMHFSCILRDIFGPIGIWGFWFLNGFLSKLIIGFLF